MAWLTPLLARWWFVGLLLVAAVAAAFVPDTARVALLTGDAHREGSGIFIVPPNPVAGQAVTLYVRDPIPLPHVVLTVNGESVAWQQEATQQGAFWEWEWQVTLADPLREVAFYYDCAEGCRERARQTWAATTPANTLPTKLGVVFPDPTRNWHGRSGWAVELTYAELADAPYWGVDDLAERVATHHANGLRVLVRVDYQQGQSLTPANDAVALDSYLRYLRRVARDARLHPVFGYIIGSGYNSMGNNSRAPDHPVTAEWAARLFNGYGEDPTHSDNALQTIRAEQPTARVLVGGITPWNHDQSGTLPDPSGAAWLSYFNTLVAAIDESTTAKTAVGVAFAAPDGFALQAPGRVAAPELAGRDPALEPTLPLPREAWGGAQVGFQVYSDWLAIINRYPTTSGKPAYITSTNTFTADDPTPPAQNYPAGWLTAAYETVQAEPQIHALCWFLDTDGSGSATWDLFSLNRRAGLVLDAADELDALLQR